MPDWSAFKQRQQQSWATGDFSMLATAITLVGELLCESVDPRAGQRVLDVATGSGNTALAAARRGCDVTGIDFVPALLERGRERAAAERLDITFQEGDTESIPFPDGAFDVVLSTFGAMFAPDQEKAAGQLLRVCRSGGKIGMANWTMDSFITEIGRTSGRYMPPPPTELKPPALWGEESRVRELFGDRVSSIQIKRRTFTFRYRSIRQWVEFNGKFLGPVIQTMRALDPAKQESLVHEIVELAKQRNRSGDQTMVVPSDYLEIVAVKR
jgi:ubiquinone/menaquinone biosynthesis C-methylase UbiE